MSDLIKEVAIDTANRIEPRGRTYSPDHYVEFATAFHSDSTMILAAIFGLWLT